MDKRIASDLMMVALELRLAAHDPNFTSPRLTDGRLLELAELVEGALLSLESHEMTREVSALKALARRGP